MEKEKKSLVSDEEIQKALNFLENLGGDSSTGDELEKGGGSGDADSDELDRQIAELQRKKEEIQKSLNPEKTGGEIDYDSLVKAVSDELSSKFESFANISKSLVEGNEEISEINKQLNDRNEELAKSIQGISEQLGKLSETVGEIANSPINKLGSFKKLTSIDKFDKSVDGDKPLLSISQNKRQILGMLEKSLETEEGQRRLGSVVGLIENGYVNSENFTDISKALSNEIGGDYNFVL